MDEEDLRELESLKEIVTKDQFSGLGSTEQDLLKRREAALLKRPSYAYFRLGHNAKILIGKKMLINNMMWKNILSLVKRALSKN